ncbi:MAG: hypothetical protein QNJ16_03440 [Rhodobacter sp.]|nr:hypothetical protein [Rhodobacter sp.]
MTVIALTSIPPRFATLGAHLEALLAQRPARLCLTLPHRYLRFPDWDGVLPPLPEGVELLRDEDLGPATKFRAVFARYAQADVLIADDDCRYGPGWLTAFETARRAHPNAALAASSFDSARLGLPPGHTIVQGFGGVLLRPADLGPMDQGPGGAAIWVDDIWLSARIARAGLPIVPCPEARAAVAPVDAPAALQDALIEGEPRAILNRRAAKELQTRLGIWQHPA